MDHNTKIEHCLILILFTIFSILGIIMAYFTPPQPNPTQILLCKIGMGLFILVFIVSLTSLLYLIIYKK